VTRQDVKNIQNEVDKLRIELEVKQRECLDLKKEDALPWPAGGRGRGIEKHIFGRVESMRVRVI
jgi:hypothetical protein